MEILHWLDDHSRLRLASTARSVFKAPDVEASYQRIAAEYGNPAAVLTDIQAGWRPEGPRIVRPAV